MKTDLQSALKRAITAFDTIKKLDPQSYYDQWMDKKFQEYVIQLASQNEIDDSNLVELLDHGWKNYWTALESWQSWQAFGSSNGASSPDDEFEFA